MRRGMGKGLRAFLGAPMAALLVAGMAGLLAAAPARAQDFPSKPVRMIVSFPPGSTTDIVSRVITQKLAELWAQPVVVENRPGAGGNIGAGIAAKTPPDGYTILSTSSAMAINLTLYASPGFAAKDFVPIVRTGETPNAIVIHPSVPAQTLRELFELGRTRPLSYASAGSGTGGHIMMEWLKREAKSDITHVPFAPATAANAVVGNQAPIGLISIPPIVAHVKAGRMRAIAVTGASRVAALPDVPTTAEAGFAGFNDVLWWAFFAPAGTPQPVVERINADTLRVLAMPDVRERLAAVGFEHRPNTAAEWADEFRREIEKYARVIPAVGAKAD